MSLKVYKFMLHLEALKGKKQVEVFTACCKVYSIRRTLPAHNPTL